MAKVTFGPIVAQARNKVSTWVFSQNARGPYVKGLVKPYQPNTAAQVNARASMKRAAQYWSQTLTAGQRAAWNAIAFGLIGRDKLGHKWTRLGKDLFTQLSRMLDTIGQGYQTSPPLSLEVSNPTAITAASASASTGLLYITLAASPAAGEILLVRATPPLGPAQNYIRQRLPIIHVGNPT